MVANSRTQKTVLKIIASSLGRPSEEKPQKLDFKKPSLADDSELTDEDILIRYENGEIMGLTVLHASERKARQKPLLGSI